MNLIENNFKKPLIEYQIVVARYNEDIHYLSLFMNIMIVYNKGNDNIPFNFNSIKLPNIGRESHTYLYHIITNYDNLANRTLFIQGKINDHKMLPFIEYFKTNDFIGNKAEHNIDLLQKYIAHSGKYLKDYNSGNMKKSKYTPFEWINLMGIDIKDSAKFQMVWGANFCVTKELIHRKPKIFYENLMKYADYDINPEEGHYFERSWYLIFTHPKFNLKKKILYTYLKDINDETIQIYNNILKNDDNINEIHIWSNNSINNNKLNIKYIHNFNYIDIYPKINNSSFNIQLSVANSFILLEFDNDTRYEIRLYTGNKYEIFDIINDKNINIYESKLTILWNSNILICDFSKICESLKIIKIKSNNLSEIKYTNNILSNIYLIYTLQNNINKTFYKDNFEEYYIDKIII